jgi:predicted ester cyclase
VSAEENKAVVRRVLAQVFNEWNLAAADELIAPGYVYHEPGTPELPGPDGFKQLVGIYRTAFPDARITVEDQVAEGDKVATRFTGRGTHRGELMGIAPTGKAMTVTGIVVSRVAGGNVEEEWENFDALGMLQQIGALPAPDQASR